MVGPENQKRYGMRGETGRLWPQAGMAPEMDRNQQGRRSSMERGGSWLYRNMHSRNLRAIGVGTCGLFTVGLVVATAMAQLPGQDVSQGIPQEFKQKLYETYEGHDFTWGGKEIYLGYSNTVVDHIASPLAIPEQLRYSEWIDDRTYTYNPTESRRAENRLHRGAKLRGKQVRFQLTEGAQAGMVKIVLGTR